MEHFISLDKEKSKVEMTIDTSVFPSDIAMKAAYSFLDRAYFFFKVVDGNFIVQCESKDGEEFDSEKMVKEYSDELLAFYLRDKLEKDNKEIRETIITTALSNAYDPNSFISKHVDETIGDEVDFDKDIDDIISEIENDPDLQFDENEISSIIDEIEANESEVKKPQIQLDPNSLNDAKKVFQDK